MKTVLRRGDRRRGLQIRVGSHLLAFGALSCATLFVPSNASAAPSATDVAVAQGLYDNAKVLMDQGKYTDACPKLEESLRLDPGLGTQYHLADCYEHLGRTASAWGGFLQVAALAKASGQTDREDVARARARALEAKVPRLFIEVPEANRLPGLQIKRDGVALAPAQWQTPIPLDPGEHAIAASVPNGKTWRSTIALQRDSVTMKVVIPSLRAPAPSDSNASPAPRPEEPPKSTGSTQRVLGLAIAGAGLVGVGVGTFFGFRSMSLHDDATSLCRGDVCTSHGTELRTQAISAGNVATIGLIAGGTALAGGVIIFLTAPHRPDSTATRSENAGAAPVLRVGIGGSGVVAQGTW
jgi:hypothetical protein